jgi:Spy/CpxP family protein refolding chaperone
MIRILEKASSILSGDQFIALAQFLAGRRAEMGSGGLSTPFDRPFGRLAAGRLGLTDIQRDQLKPVFTTFGDGLRQVREGIEAGIMTPGQARDRAKELCLTLERGARQILTPEQWKQVQTFREGRRDRQSDRRAEAQPQRVDRITAMYIRVLGLEDAEASQVRRIMEATIPARRAAAERRAQGTLGPEDFAYETMTIEKNAAGQVRGVLTPDQAKRFDALLDLLPRGPQMVGPMGRHGGRR